uniref:RUN domain-containing protein n=1 Tax=Meloidogyne javanica TaxID=6303 RepID=A0A915N7L2_MELJA
MDLLHPPLHPLQIHPNMNSVEEHFKNFSRRAQRICHENERSNLLALMRLVLNSLLDDQIRGTRILDLVESQVISDFFIIFEKCLWHGFKVPASSLIGRRKLPETEMWEFVGIASKSNKEMEDLYNSLGGMSTLRSVLSKYRGFWRLALMQKRLAEYLLCLYECPKKDNLLVEEDALLEQINSFDLTPYIRLPTLPGHFPETFDNDKDCSITTEEEYTDLRTILDQKQYLEERNRQLSANIEQLKIKVDKFSNGSSTNDVTLHRNDSSLIFTERLRDLERERDILRARLAEKEDSLAISQDQLKGTRRFTEDLYEKLKASECKIKRFQSDIEKMKELNNKEVNNLNDSLISLAKNLKNEQMEEEECFKLEFVKITKIYSETMAMLKNKNEELSAERESLNSLKSECNELNAKIKALTNIENELLELKEDYRKCKQELSESKQALQEFSEALSESKLRMVELKEEIMPLSDAKWIKDKEALQCRLCDIQFSVIQRRHHCRKCWLTVPGKS